MITKEINDWIRKAECGMYSVEDAMEEFARISRYLTREEVVMIKNRLKNSIRL
jgi:hypothetical protein